MTSSLLTKSLSTIKLPNRSTFEGQPLHQDELKLKKTFFVPISGLFSIPNTPPYISRKVNESSPLNQFALNSSVTLHNSNGISKITSDGDNCEHCS